MGRQFNWLWSAYAVSTLGTFLAFNAFSLILIKVLHSGPAQVAALSASGTLVGALVALPLGPWVEFRRKRPVMITMDLVRFFVLLTIPVAYAFGELTFAQLLVVSIVTGAADLTFTAASGAHLRTLVAREDLMVANGRFESTQWTATVLGMPLGGAAIGLFGPVVTIVADAVSYLLSALGIRAIGGGEASPPAREGATGLRIRDLVEGWRHILKSPALRPLYFNSAAANCLIMAQSPLLAVLMLGRLGFPAWEFGLVFAVPCLGGLLGSRLSPHLVARYGRPTVLRAACTLRAVWPIGLAFVGPGWPGLLLVMVVEGGLITFSGVYNPVLATHRLEHAGTANVTRVLSAWSITNKTSIAVATALWGVIATLTSPRFGLGLAGALLLATPLLLPRGRRAGVFSAPATAPVPLPAPAPAPVSVPAPAAD
nr:MFS transporter [Catenulispora pinistramenti]